MPQKEHSVLVLGEGAAVQTVCRIFSESGAAVKFVSDLKTAVPALLDCAPQLIILDFVSATDAALHFYSALRSVSVRGVDSRIPVVALLPEVNSDIQDEIAQAAPQGFDVVLETPLNDQSAIVLRRFYKKLSGEHIPDVDYDGRQAADCQIYPEKHLADEYGLDADDVAVLYERFVRSMPEELEQLAAAVRSGELNLVARLAHSIAGSFLDMIAHGPAQTARSIEHHARAGDTALLDSLLSELNRQCLYVTREIRRRQR
ncbi:Hpt domain-containing protein [Oleidesulfovibrio sp.]|uniref:Hpt domain-containing protein n=1 Tax=Oleidesulfovibrio sp. TaxID=2909707 RepID=UPI003A8BD412